MALLDATVVTTHVFRLRLKDNNDRAFFFFSQPICLIRYSGSVVDNTA